MAALGVTYQVASPLDYTDLVTALRRLGPLNCCIKKPSSSLHIQFFRPFPPDSALQRPFPTLQSPVKNFENWEDKEQNTRFFTYSSSVTAGLFLAKGQFMPIWHSSDSVIFIFDCKLCLFGVKFIMSDQQYKIQIKFKDIVSLHMHESEFYMQVSYCPKYFVMENTGEVKPENADFLWFANDLKPNRFWKQVKSPIWQEKDQFESFTGRIMTFRVRFPFPPQLETLIQTSGLRLNLEPIHETPFQPPKITHFHLQFSPCDFETKYLILSLLSLCYTTCYHLSYRFLITLQSKPPAKSKLALKRLLALRRPFDTDLIDIESEFDRKYSEIRGEVVILQSMVPRILVTPSTVYFTVPEYQVPNRVTRQFQGNIMSFLRVSFVTEHLSSLIGPSEYELNRIKQEFLPRFQLLDRCYELLAFSSSQLRERSLWMLASNEEISREKVVNWMGDFRNIHKPAKRASRMGLCLTNTENRIRLEEKYLKKIEDVERNGYNFSDGAGTISRELLGGIRNTTSGELDGSAVQIRIRGIKGVVNLDPRLLRKQLCFRPSMEKFPSSHLELEILNVACYRQGYLNRQFITLLDTLGIPFEVFHRLQLQAITACKAIITSAEELTNRALYASKADFASPIWTTIYRLLATKSSNFNQTTDPFLQSVAKAVFTVAKTEIHERQRILVDKSALLMGVMDEFGILGPDEVFIQLNKFDTGSEIITGPVAICKNPCFHPGDFRKLTAVPAKPGLDHCFNVLVFPQTGDRPHPNEITGSDLDGDLFFVTWDQDLTSFSPRLPMEFSVDKEKSEGREVTIEQIAEFFMQYMTSDVLGRVANTHLALATIKPEKADAEECLKLAKLHSTAVDFAKTGERVDPNSIPQVQAWPDFMRKKHYESWDSSHTVIGKLWRESEIIEEEKVPFEMYEIREYAGNLEEIKEIIDDYEMEIKGIMNIYGIESEVEVVTGEITTFAKHFKNKNKYKRREETRHRLVLMVKMLKKKFEERLRRIDTVESSMVCLKVAYDRGLFAFPWLVAGDQLLVLAKSS